MNKGETEASLVDLIEKAKPLTKSAAFKAALETYPTLKPTVATGFTMTQDRKAVVIGLYGEDISLVVYHETDLYRLIDMCQMALQSSYNK